MAIKEVKRKTDGITVYMIDFRDQKRRRVREVAGTTRTQAKTVLEKRIGEVRAGTYVNPADLKRNDPTFAAFADRFLKEYAAGKRSDYYSQSLRAADESKDVPEGPIRRYFGTKRLREITAEDLDRYRQACFTADGVGPSTTRKRLTVLGTLFKMARRWGVLVTNPAADIVKPPEPKHKVRFLSAGEWTKLLAVAPPHRAALYRMAVATGMRLKELTGLRWEDVNTTAKLLHVAEDTKTGTRAIPLGSEAEAALKAQKERRTVIGREQSKLAPYVFTDLEAEHFHTRQRRNKLSKVVIGDMTAAGIADASFHTLRHTAAAWMVQAGRSLYEVQRVLGHSTPLMTQRYAHLEPKHLRGAVEALDAAMRGVDTPVDKSAPADSTTLNAPAGSATLSATSVVRGPLAQG
jgi:site-specific recombinase XerD